ncbi:MAG TPA: M4 family metallopeptidase, partial [Holophagaceae bacterium]
MATTRGRLALSYLAATLAAGALCAGANPQESLRVNTAASRLLAQRSQLGLDADNDFHLGRAHTDGLGQTHGHFQQMYKGVRVWGGDVITHTDREGNPLPSTNALKRNIHLNVLPALGTDEILAIVHQDLNPKGPYAYAPSTELVIYPETVTVTRPGRRSVDGEANAEDVTRQVLRYTLAYHVHTALENGAEETAHTDYLVNAHTGAILKKWNTLHTSAAVGTGNSQYSGTVQINTNSTASGFELRDMTRGTGGTFGNNVVTDLAHATSGNGTIYTNSTNTWGDGANYNGGSTTSANGQTAAVDAAYGIQATWDMYKNVLGRNGIDNTGKASYLRVHYSTSYDNAFWDDTCFCMTFGDGSQFKSLESVDVAGHEMSHGVCATSVPGGLTYSGESGGLNESNSDIFGTMVEFYDLGGGEAANATTIPATGGNWTIGEQLETASFPTPLRYMYKPSKDGTSPDAWSSTIGSLDVHYSSGPGNREFYFLSQGASATSTSDFYSSYTPAGFAGVGNDHAARIHYRALTTYYTSNETYADARTAHINAAKDLYGAGSPEEQAVWNSFAAI